LYALDSDLGGVGSSDGFEEETPIRCPFDEWKVLRICGIGLSLGRGYE
jgi:hypothetical protein